jgi:mRNA-degrading endonuclease RelE of RelBE toxin-antitoxin system
MSFNVITTTGFRKHAKKIGKKHYSLKSDIEFLIDLLEQNPFQGEPLGNDCYKVRLAISSKGKGKSGGARVITCVKVVDSDVYLLAIYDKSVKESISDNELDELLKIAGLI